MMPRGFGGISAWLDEPVEVVRLALVRVLAPLSILGFMSKRLAHADKWIGAAGFRVPDLGGDWRQPIFVPALPSGCAWAVAATMIASGLSCSVGCKTRPSALIFAATLAVAVGPAGTRLGVDAWWAARRGAGPSDAMAPARSMRFLQLLPITIYSASGIAKARGDWLKVPLVLWTHLHDSYQTSISFALASVLPGWAWTLFQGLVLVFEVFAPLWFWLPRTRSAALVFGLGMHAMIGLMFGPVLWFALLMMTLLAAGYLPDRFVAPLDVAADHLEKRRSERGRPMPK